MKEIQLDCFATTKECKIISAVRSFEISNPLDQRFVLEINNHSDNNCQFILEIKNLVADALPKTTNLLLTDEQKPLFEGSLGNFLQQKNNLGVIGNNSIKKYFFDFNFLGSALENQKIQANFDLLFHLHCQSITPSQPVAPSKPIAPTDGEVLAAKDENKGFDSASEINPAYVSLILCSLAFFVIMKFIHGKKKKSQR